MENSRTKYCQSCGTASDVGTIFCTTCGETNNFSSTPPLRIKTPIGVLVLGILQILGSIVAIALGLTLGAALFPLIPGGSVVIVVLSAFPLLFAIFFLLGFNFARILMLIGAVLDIISIVGILWGILLIWYLTRPRVKAYFNQPKGHGV